MCSRFTLNLGAAINLSKRLGIPLDETAAMGKVRYNIAPTASVTAFRARAASNLRWGLIPHWTRAGRPPRAPLINARSETVATKPSFRTAWQQGQRCAIPATGFYEWEKQGRRRWPWLFQRRDGAPLAFAGLWDRWENPVDGTIIESCTVLTTTPNEIISRIHDRMPALLDENTAPAWLDPDNDAVEDLITSYPADRMTETALDTYVNSPAHDDPVCLTPRGQTHGTPLDLFPPQGTDSA